MTLTLWKNSGGSIIVDSSGHPILCDHCPCGKVIPAGTVVKYSLTRTFSRDYDVTTGSTTGAPSVLTWSSRKRIHIIMRVEISGEYELLYDIAVHSNGTWIPLINTNVGTASVAVSFDDGSYAQIDYTETAPEQTTTERFAPSDSGMIVWYGDEKAKMDYIQSAWRWKEYSGYPGTDFSLPMLTWLKDGQTAYFNDSLLERTGYWDQGTFSETITGGNKTDYGITENVTVTHVDENNGYAEANFGRTANGSYEHQTGGPVEYGSGVDTCTDIWKAEWELIPPNGACQNCGL